jgi:hypothetical protein
MHACGTDFGVRWKVEFVHRIRVLDSLIDWYVGSIGLNTDNVEILTASTRHGYDTLPGAGTAFDPLILHSCTQLDHLQSFRTAVYGLLL